jgi:hypothetical protein
VAGAFEYSPRHWHRHKLPGNCIQDHAYSNTIELACCSDPVLTAPPAFDADVWLLLLISPGLCSSLQHLRKQELMKGHVLAMIVQLPHPSGTALTHFWWSAAWQASVTTGCNWQVNCRELHTYIWPAKTSTLWQLMPVAHALAKPLMYWCNTMMQHQWMYNDGCTPICICVSVPWSSSPFAHA